MQHVAGPYSAGTVIVPTSGTPRYTAFYRSLESVRVPAGSRLTTTESSDLAAALNKAVDQATGDWVWFLGDDHTFPPDILFRLLSHGLPAVVALNVQRVPPFGPVILKGPTRPEAVGLDWDDVPVGGGLWYLPARHYAGSAGLLIHRTTLDRLERPYFRVGQYNPERLNEDFYIFDQLARLGIPTVVDLGARMGHLNAYAAVPRVHEGRWTVTFTQNDKPVFSMDPAAMAGPRLEESASTVPAEAVPV